MVVRYDINNSFIVFQVQDNYCIPNIFVLPLGKTTINAPPPTIPFCASPTGMWGHAGGRSLQRCIP